MFFWQSHRCSSHSSQKHESCRNHWNCRLLWYTCSLQVDLGPQLYTATSVSVIGSFKGHNGRKNPPTNTSVRLYFTSLHFTSLHFTSLPFLLVPLATSSAINLRGKYQLLQKRDWQLKLLITLQIRRKRNKDKTHVDLINYFVVL